MSEPKNLAQLMQKSKSCRNYLLSLPVSIQMELHSQNDYIHTAADLREKANLLIQHGIFLKKMDGEF